MRVRGKVEYFNWDFINSKDDSTAMPVCLTWAERQILLTMVDYIGWQTRWIADTGTISFDQIEQWRDSITYKLMGECAVNCNDVWTCLGITTPPSSLEAWIIAQIGSNPDVIQVVQQPEVADIVSPIVTEIMIAECDPDLLFGFLKQLIQFINRCVEDFYERWEAELNAIEWTAIVSEKVPSLVFIAEYVNFLQESVVEAYYANYDATLEEEYICDLFCKIIGTENCTMTWMDLYEYFMNRIGAGLAQKDLLDLLQFILAGSWSGSEFCDLSFASFCGVMHNLQAWAGIDLQAIKRLWASWSNDADSDWSTLCTSCGWTFIETFDDPIANPFGVFSLHDFGAGWVPTTAGAVGTADDLIDTTHEYVSLEHVRERCSFEVTLATPVNITRVKVVYEAVTQGNPLSRIHLYNGVTEVDTDEWILSDTEGTPTIRDFETDVTVDKIWIDLVCGLDDEGGTPGGSLNCPSVTIQGTGTIPPEFT